MLHSFSICRNGLTEITRLFQGCCLFKMFLGRLGIRGHATRTDHGIKNVLTHVEPPNVVTTLVISSKTNREV